MHRNYLHAIANTCSIVAYSPTMRENQQRKRIKKIIRIALWLWRLKITRTADLFNFIKATTEKSVTIILAIKMVVVYRRSHNSAKILFTNCKHKGMGN